MPVTRLELQYDGTAFHGWAVQPGHRTVQGVVEAALAQLRGGRPAPLVVAGRTDAGVHALGQVASYAGEPVPVRGLNALLPGDVAAVACAAAPDGFDARSWALSRSYLFRVLVSPVPSPFERGRALWWPHAVDLGALRACAAALCGEHDFTAFTPTATQHVRFRRVVEHASWTAHPASPEVDVRRASGGGAIGTSDPGRGGAGGGGGGLLLEFRIEADAFLRQMNRILVGTMLEVAGGRRTVESFAALLRGARRPDAGPTAPPHGLHLLSVRHGDGPAPRRGDA